MRAFCAAYPRYVAAVLDGRGRANGDVRLRPDVDVEARAAWIDRDTGRISERALAQLAYSARWLLVDGHEDLLREGYRATMHIDLLESHQGQGWGRKLLEALVESMKAAAAAAAVVVPEQDEDEQDGDDSSSSSGKSRGIWLGVGGENSKVVPFYEKLGFRVKEREVKTSTIIMVRDY